MIHLELCSACSGSLQLGVGLVLILFKQKNSIDERNSRSEIEYKKR